MKSKLTSLLLVVTVLSFFSAFGQSEKATDVLWPLSTTSQEAKLSFAQALDRLWNARIDEYHKKMDETLKADPNFFLAHANAAIVQYTEDKDKAMPLIDKALALPQDKLTPPEKSVRKVLADIKDNKTDNIKSTLDEIISAYPDVNQSYQFAIGLSRFVINDKDLSASYAKMAVNKFPNDAPAWNQLGYHYMDKDQMDKAEEAFNNYLRLRPNEANAHDSYGDFCMKKGNYEEARKHYEEAVDMGMASSRERAEKARVMAQGGGGDEN